MDLTYAVIVAAEDSAPTILLSQRLVRRWSVAVRRRDAAGERHPSTPSAASSCRCSGNRGTRRPTRVWPRRASAVARASSVGVGAARAGVGDLTDARGSVEVVAEQVADDDEVVDHVGEDEYALATIVGPASAGRPAPGPSGDAPRSMAASSSSEADGVQPRRRGDRRTGAPEGDQADHRAVAPRVKGRASCTPDDEQQRDGQHVAARTTTAAASWPCRGCGRASGAGRPRGRCPAERRPAWSAHRA